MRVALYTRVSTRKRKGADSDEPGTVTDYRQNPALQSDACRQFAASRGWDIVVEYTDRMSGAKDVRPELEKLKLAAHQRQFDAVLVWKLDRFARHAAHAILAIEDLNARGIAFISVTEPQIDTTTPMGRAMLGVVAVFAQLERDTLAERVKAGIASAKARGKWRGRPTVAVPVVLVEKYLAEGMKWAALARKLGVSESSIRRALKAQSKTPHAEVAQ